MSVPWTNAVADCRVTLSDGATDKLAYRKKVLNEQNGSNLVFKTFEARRISSFVTPTSPAGVYLDNSLVTVTAEDLESGEFTLATAPTDGQSLLATYYYQWFDDSELDGFLVNASNWAGFGDDYLLVPDAFRPAVREYVAFLGYQKLVSKMSVNLAETYQLYDAPDEKRFNPVDMYMKISKQKYDLAVRLRDDVYERKGAAKAPRSATLVGTVRDVPPNR
jgi:hypothetical protein